MKDDLEKYIEKRKTKDKNFALDFEVGYENFKIGAMLKVLRENAGLTQEQLAEKLNTKKSAISRIENHSEDIRFSTLLDYAKVFNKSVYLRII
jgi:DNA-binding XRE family transcriptional regulator